MTTRVARPRGGTEGDAAPGVVTFFVEGKLVNPLNGAHGHWSGAAKYRQRWRWRTKLAYLALPLSRPLGQWGEGPKRVTLTAYTWNRLDTDGLQASLKSVRDALMDCALITSDDPASGNVFEYEQVIDRANRGVRIRVETIAGRGAREGKDV